jgi:predicted DNA-binding transcriptional regulator AlpA
MPTRDEKPVNSSKPNPLLIDIKEVGKLLGRSVASIQRDDERGRIPRPVRIGGSKLWRLSELRKWVRAGCPVRYVWEGRGGHDSLFAVPSATNDEEGLV